MSRRDTLILLAAEDIDCLNADSDVTVLAGLGGENLDDLGVPRLEEDVSVFAQYKACVGQIREAPDAAAVSLIKFFRWAWQRRCELYASKLRR